MPAVDSAHTGEAACLAVTALGVEWGLERLGRKVFENNLAIPRRFYLLGVAYAAGARSLRKASRLLLLRKGHEADPTEEAALKKLDVHPGTLTRCIRDMETLIEEHFGLARVELVARQDEGESYCGLTSTGQVVWEKVKVFLERYWR